MKSTGRVTSNRGTSLGRPGVARITAFSPPSWEGGTMRTIRGLWVVLCAAALACGRAPESLSSSEEAVKARCAAPTYQCGKGAGAYCADLSTDANNCGACGSACPSGYGCANGSCELLCQPGLTRCTSAGGTAYCFDISSDAGNCGACGAACAAGQVCSGGVCQSLCATGETICPGPTAPICASLQTDNQD